MTRIAVVGMSCRYPGADSVDELWGNVVAGRRAFRELPAVRMRLADYWDADPATPDRFYSRQAAVLEGYEFDRIGHRIAGSTYRSTDLTHWLALDMAGEALADAGFPEGRGLPADRTGVVVGNTLTGEFSRANSLRLRWPYVQRVVAAGLRAQGWPDDQLATFLADTERRFKSPFPPVDEDTLAGGLSNTIAGRICNHYDLRGGGYTVDGACASSLLSVVTACRSLVEGDVDVAVAGGVDLSIDPFEMVGFAKAGALARGEMRVYDEQSGGFWPGEGCGMVVLMRHEDAVASGRPVLASIAGWGVSSDGRGGMTRPEADGYRLALDRAYRRAGFGIGTVPLFEGHGTGTRVGDDTELRALSEARREHSPDAVPAAIGSIKALIGHTKAAAGIAGLIKTAMALRHGVIPPTAGCLSPHPALTAADRALRPAATAEMWPAGVPARAGVTAMGFGGINTHLVLEAGAPVVAEHVRREQVTLSAGNQDCELLLLAADDLSELRDRVRELLPALSRMAYGELTDLAVNLAREGGGGACRLAVVAASPAEATARMRAAATALNRGSMGAVADGVLLHRVGAPPRIGFLFPGQGSGRGFGGGALARRFVVAAEAHRSAALPAAGDTVATEAAQPRIAAGSLAALAVLRELGVDAVVAAGHSLGELAALHWAGSFDGPALLRAAATRGDIMARLAEPGTMAGIAAEASAVRELCVGEPVVIAGFNGPHQTVIAGERRAVRRVCARASADGLQWAELAVSHAFHSPLMAAAEREFGRWLDSARLAAPRRPVVSTVTGSLLDPETDLAGLLRRQVTAPVRFAEALAETERYADLLIEVGPGQVLTRMARDLASVPVLATASDSPSLAGLLGAVGAAWAMGAGVDLERLFDGRSSRPFDLAAEPRFLAGPCESAPPIELSVAAADVPRDAAVNRLAAETGDPLPVLRRLAAERAELPAESISPDTRPLDDLQLSSIAVGQLVAEASAELGLGGVQAPTNFATATLRQIAEALGDLAAEDSDGGEAPVEGVASWVRAFTVELTAEAVPAARGGDGGGGEWQLFAPADHAYAKVLRDRLADAGLGPGVLLCLPPGATPDDLEPALRAAQAAVAQPPGGRFVVAQHGRGAAGLARTARLEGADLRTTVVDVPPGEHLVEQVVAEVAATDGYAEARLGQDGDRRVPVLRLLPMDAPVDSPPILGPDDVVLVTGGGKGITAESALALARGAGARLALLGRADPATDPELAANLERFRAAGVEVRYLRADVTDPAAVRTAVRAAEEQAGPITVVLHGAGANRPAPLTALDFGELRATMAPKVDGLHAVLAALDPERLRLLVTFGSVIGRTGLHGEGHYAVANDWLAGLTAEVAERPDCRAVCLEWSVWAGVGMGERLGAVESLLRAGVTPIGADDGIRLLRQVLAQPSGPACVVVTGRTGGLDTLRQEQRELPLLRFLERPLVHYAGVELVVEADLGTVTDPYLADHDLDGVLLLPAVVGMEAMAQAAAGVSGETRAPALSDLAFPRPIVVPRAGRTTIRIAALRGQDGRIDVTIRSSETGFTVDHFRGVARFEPCRDDRRGPAPQTAGLPPVPLDPQRELYGDLLFQGPRFQRLLRYHRLAARAAEADVSTVGEAAWFGAFLPQQLLLGDPGARDALMHGIQVCVPEVTLLPIGVDRVATAGRDPAAGETVRLVAVERDRAGDTFEYDLSVLDAGGAEVESWTGLRLRAVGRPGNRRPWPPALLGPLLERWLEDVLGVSLDVVLEPHPAGLNGGRRAVTALAAGRAAGRPVTPRYRPDGAPEQIDGRAMTAAHSRAASLLLRGPGPLACDLETVDERPAAVWAGMLGRHAALAETVASGLGEPPAVASTRVWSAVECLRKAGLPQDAPLALEPDDHEGVLFRSGRQMVATRLLTLAGSDSLVVVAVLADGGERDA